LLYCRLILAPENLSSLESEDPESDTCVGEIACCVGDLGALFRTDLYAEITTIEKVEQAFGHYGQCIGECRAEIGGGSVEISWRPMMY